MSSVRIYIDFKAPAAYLALQPTLSLLAETGASAEWRPYVTQQQPVPVEAPDEDRGATHRRVRALARRRTHLHYADVQGIAMRFPEGEFPGSTLALAAMAQLVDPLPVIEAAFASYWAGGEDLDAPGVVARLLREVGAPDVALDALDPAALAETWRETALEDGVVDVPAYVVGEHLFVGREHLPWIRTLLV